MSVADETFEGLRPLLFSIAYRMLGSVMEAEDMVQEAYLRYENAQPETIQSPKAFLCTVVTRLSLDQLKSAKSKREEYFGEWLPEPLLTEPTATPSAIIGERENISMAFMVLLESLSPIERAVFLLREVFDYPYDEIARIVDKTEANCRQYYHRAKQYIVERRPRFVPSPDEQQRLLQVFTIAISTGDLDLLNQVLAESVTMTGDGGGKAFAARHPVVGRAAVARFLMGLFRNPPADGRVELRNFNGAPALIIEVGSQIMGVMNFTMSGDQIVGIDNVLNPDKLGHIKSAGY
ncbi:MAG: RNA polymerase sigma-70 factor [Chloroflexota bacterium]